MADGNDDSPPHSRVSELANSFDPLEWAEKRKLAMAKASELRDRRRAHSGKPAGTASDLDHSFESSPRPVRAESRDSVSTEGGADGSNWKWISEPVVPSASSNPPIPVDTGESIQPVSVGAVAAAPTKAATPVMQKLLPTRRLTKPAVPKTSSTRVRAVTSPPDKRMRKPTAPVPPSRMGDRAQSAKPGLPVRPARIPVPPIGLPRQPMSLSSGARPAAPASGRMGMKSNQHASTGMSNPGESVKSNQHTSSVNPRVVVAPVKRPLTTSATTAHVARTGLPAVKRTTVPTPPLRAKPAVSHSTPRPMPPPSSGTENQATDNDPVTRQMIDRDTLRLENRAMFVEAISFWRSKHPHSKDVTHSGHPAEPSTPSTSSVQVYVRKRPLFDREAVAREYDIVTVVHPSTIVTHNCLFQADLKTPYLMHSRFHFSRCFDERTSNAEVYAQSARGLVALASEGGLATICCFGQTGSGKTHTMTAIEDLTSEELFAQRGVSHVSITFIELCGKKILDLLSESKEPVRLREGPEGLLVVDGAVSLTVSSPAELSALMATAHSRRNTESTGANDVSSRSHAVCMMQLDGKGKLLLVDLAGSERRKDSMWHDKERQREGAEINASLHALKECIRWRAGGGRGAPPFRLSTLTRVLAETFSNPEARLSVIATVSPCATDVEHTVSTLKAVYLLTGQGSIAESKQTEMRAKDLNVTREVPPKKWSPDQVRAWLAREGEKDLGMPQSTTGAMLVRMPESRFVQLSDERRGAKLYRSLHALM